MWSWSLNCGEVTPDIVIGTCPITLADLDCIIRKTRVSALLSLQHDDCLAYWHIDYAQLSAAGARAGVVMARVPVRDFDIAEMRQRLPQAVTELATLRGNGHRVYVHCTAGLGRSPLTVLAYLSLVEGYSPEMAIGLIHAARPGAVPAWEAFHGCCEDLETRHREAIETRAYQLYQQGIYGDANADWRQARAEVLRSALSGYRL
jgi:atypical dual specificity phosphatase